MGVSDAKSRAGLQGREAARRGLEKVNDLMHTGSSVDDRVVTNPDPEEQEPKQTQAKPIVSINGEDVDRTSAEKEQNRPERKRPAA